MLKFKILNPYKAGSKAGHDTQTFDTTLEEDVKAASREFDKLLKEGRVALLEVAPNEYQQIRKMPREGNVEFLLPMAGG